MSDPANLDLYQTYVAAADKWDREAFDAHLIGGLLASVSEETARQLLDAAARVNRRRS
jgi:hypothetical protein